METFVMEGRRFYYTPSAAVAAGDVVQMKDMIAVAVTDIAASAQGVVEVGRVHQLPADATTAFSQGDQLYWSLLRSKLYREPGALRIPAGFAASAKAQAGTTADVLLGVHAPGFGQSDVPDVIRFREDFLSQAAWSLAAPPPPWAVIDTSAAGTPTLIRAANVHGGVLEGKLAVTDEAEAIGIDFGDQLLFDVDSLITARFRFRAPTLNAADEVVIGMISAQADAPASLTEGVWASADGAQDVHIESDDGTTRLDDQDSGLDLGNDVWADLVMDFASKSDVRVALAVAAGGQPARVLSAVTFDLSEYAAGLQPAAWITKSGGAQQTNLDAGLVDIWSKID